MFAADIVVNEFKVNIHLQWAMSSLSITGKSLLQGLTR
jgi:hypothetical protein